MDDLYDWQASILASAREDNKFSLWDLLNIIPTDIPKDASEFDEELRNIIIDLYSDSSISLHVSESNAKYPVNPPSHVNQIEESVVHGKVLIKNGHKENIACKIKTPVDSFKNANKGIIHINQQSESLDTIKSENDSNYKEKKENSNAIPFSMDITSSDNNDTCLELAKNKLDDDKDYSQDKCEIKQEVSKFVSNENDAVKCEPVALGAEGTQLDKGIGDFSSHKTGFETYQSNLDELGDGQTAQLLTSFTDWISKMSSDPPKDLFGNVSLLGDLPKCAYLDVHSKGLAMGEAMDQISPVSKPSELLEDDILIKTHPLTVIAEETDVVLKQETDIELGIDEPESSQSSFDLGSSTHDSGIGSIIVLSHLQEESDAAIEPTEIETSAVITDREHAESQGRTYIKTGPSNFCDDDNFLAELEQRLNTIDKKAPKSELVSSSAVDSKLDSHIQALSSDYSILMKEKMKLKKIIWSLEEDLAAERKLLEIKNEEKIDIHEQKSQIEAVVLELEERLRNFETENERQDESLRETVEKLQRMNQAYDELKSKIFDTEEKFKRQNGELEKTKTELKGCISEAKTSNESKEKCESQLKMLSEAFQKLKQSKDWLEFQLKTLSDSRAKMQLQFEEAKTERNNKAIALSELQAENKKLSTKLAELNYASASEKSEIVKQMEIVENEIKEYDLLYARLEKENKTFSLLINERNKIIETNEAKIKELIEIVAAAEGKIEKLTTELSKRENTVEDMKNDMENTKAKIEEYERLVKELEEENTIEKSRIRELEQKMLNLQGEVDMKEERMSLLISEKEGLKKNLEAANEEKAEFESAALALKNDMQKVNMIFHIMKKDLASKSSLLQTIDAKKMELINEMKDLQEYMSEQGRVQNELRDALKNKIETVRFLTEGKEALTVEVEQLKTKYKTMQEDLDNAVRAKEGLERDSEALQSAWRKQKEEFEIKIDDLTTECEAITSRSSETEKCMIELRNELKTMTEDFQRHRKESQCEIANLRAKENKLTTKLKEKQNEWLKKEENYESSIMSLVERLKEESIKAQHLVATCSEQKKLIDEKERNYKLLAEKLRGFAHHVGLLKQERDIVSRELLRLKSSIPKIFSFVASAVDRMGLQLKESSQSNDNLMEVVNNLKLELVKSGNRTALMEKKLQLEQERVANLERDVETKQDELKGAKKQILVLKKDKDLGVLKFGQYKKSAEERFTAADKEKNELAAQVKMLKDENRLMLAKLEQREKDLEETTTEKIEQGRKLSEIEKSYCEILSAKNEAVAKNSKITSAYEELQGVIFSLENQLGIERSQTRVLQDQIGSLKWQQKQASAEVQVKKNELDVLKSHHDSELRNINSLLDVAKTELKCLRTEVSETRKEKQKCNGLLIEARERLRRQANDSERLQKDILKRNEDLIRLKEDMSGCKSTATREMLDFIVKKAVIKLPNLDVLEDDAKHKPSSALATLRKCMSALRVEMDTLHTEMSSQQECLQGSRSKLSEFQENFGHLQSACQSLHQKSSQPSKSENHLNSK
ncbi:myosin-3-like [Rhopilema esculentum]|uniref:myosin-3-like n=1 Tax=Rhopilema esculentum TaxID=499914 RepID=UPI0031D3FBBB